MQTLSSLSSLQHGCLITVTEKELETQLLNSETEKKKKKILRQKAGKVRRESLPDRGRTREEGMGSDLIKMAEVGRG